MEGTTTNANIGKYKSAGLPNHSHNFVTDGYRHGKDGQNPNNKFLLSDGDVSWGGGWNNRLTITTTNVVNNSVYSDNVTTVQPPAGVVIYLIKY